VLIRESGFSCLLGSPGFFYFAILVNTGGIILFDGPCLFVGG